MSFSYQLPLINPFKYVATFTTRSGVVVDIYRDDIQQYLMSHPNDMWIPTAQQVARVGYWLIQGPQEKIEDKE